MILATTAMFDGMRSVRPKRMTQIISSSRLSTFERFVHRNCTCASRVVEKGGLSLGQASLRFRCMAKIEPTSGNQESEIEMIEVDEPLLEKGAEIAALTVAGSAAFGAVIWAVLGKTKAEEYFAGYLLEQSLSVDNLFVFILVFRYFGTPARSQKTVLSYGIITAAILRLILIVIGADAVERWKPILLVFAAILVFSSYKLLAGNEEEEESLENNAVVKFSRSLFQFTDEYDGENFFTTLKDGTRAATPLLLVLLVIELSDVIFAVDSIPAVFGVTLDPFIVYSSNIFAILSLRGLYSFVSSIMTKLAYLEKSVAVVLGFIGFKIIADFAGFMIPTETSLGLVASILGSGIIASLLVTDADEAD